MARFLLLSTRADDETATEERESFTRFGGLAPDELVQVRLEQGPMPAIDLDAWDGIFLGGSPYNASSPEKTPTQVRVETELVELVHRVLEAGTPFFGACYGVGVVGLATNAVIDGQFAEPPGVITVSVTEAGRADPILAGVPETFDAAVGHKEACSRLPEGAVLLGAGSACPNQLFRLGERLWVTQFHPELGMAGFASRLRFYRHAGYCAPEEAEARIEAAARRDLGMSHRVLANFVTLHRDRTA